MTTRPERILGIDPGRASGVAVVTVERCPRLLHAARVMTVKRDVDIPVTSVIQTLVEKLDGKRVLAVVEHQYVGQNMRTAITLAQRAGRWIEACLYVGIDVEIISASSWQARELPKLRKRELLKKAAVARVKGIWGVDIGPDPSDAALMARFRAIQIAMAGRRDAL